MTSDYFDKAVEFILSHEGMQYNNNISDPGGASAMGISLRFLKAFTALNPSEFYRFDIDSDKDIDAQDVRGLTIDGAKYLYKKEFWNKYNYGAITNFLVARKIFDLSVNMGGISAHKVTQRAIRAASGTVLLEDGVLGPKTLNAINGADATALLAAIKSEAAGFYRVLTHVDPKLAVFLNGWVTRAYD